MATLNENIVAILLNGIHYKPRENLMKLRLSSLFKQIASTKQGGIQSGH